MASYTVTEHATRENNFINNLVEDWEDNEFVYECLAKIQNNHNINIWFYRPIHDSAKAERLEKNPDLSKVYECKNTNLGWTLCYY